MKTSAQLKRDRKLRRLQDWLIGRLDRAGGHGMRRNYGDYLDGYHSGEFDTPDFLLPSEYIELKRELNVRS